VTDTDEDAWRIDDLAQRAGISVDTIRYYQREGLLRSGERVGRSQRYGPEHLERLERIRGLQARRFSLAAIRALLDHDGPLESLLAERGGVKYDREALIAAAGSSESLVAGLERARFLRPPSEYEREDYDGEDVEMLRAFADLSDLGVPDDVLVAIGVVVAERVDQLQRAIIEVFAGRSGPTWDDIAKARFEEGRYEQSARFLRDMRVVMDHIQHRTAQRIVLEALRNADDA